MKCVTVDFDKCTGLGICESLAPDFSYHASKAS